MGKLTKKEIFSIPNLMGYFRIILIPVFVYLYIKAQTKQEYYIAAFVIGISALTDLFDGMVARKFHMITELGKALDPIADKLTHGAVLLCLALRYSQILILVALFVIKEGYMGIMGIIKLRSGKKLDGAMWFGKLCTAVLFVTIFLLLLIPDMPLAIVNFFVVVCSIVMILALILYIPVFQRL